MVNWEQIRKEIYEETHKTLEKQSGFDVNNTIELFELVLSVKLNKAELKLDGLETRIGNSLQNILINDISMLDRQSYFPDFAKIEAFLRKILFLINPSKLTTIESQNKGLISLINGLNLNSLNINFDTETEDSLRNASNFGLHLYRVYHLRNIESHQCQKWTKREFYENIESILIIYLFVVNKFKVQLQSIVDKANIQKEQDFKIYLNSVKENFKSRIGRFIHIKGQEDIRLSQSFVIENITNQDNDRVERKGTVNELRRSKIPEKRMLIWGDAGMGKSTTLEFLAHYDADKKLKDLSSNLPVYISLGLLTDKNISLKQSIFSKVGVDEITGERMLREGKFNLFLDAVNEIPRDHNHQLKTIRQREIQNLITEYKDCFIIISNRPQDENTFKDIPVFQLQKMDKEQIELFVKKNSDSQETAKIILSEIGADERLEKIIKTPLMLSRLIEIVKVKGSIPKSEGEIIDKFIFSLYQREVDEKKDANFNIKTIHRLLRNLGYESLEKKETNSGMSEDEILNYFVECKKNYGFDIDTVYVLEIATQLGILENRENLYTFAHQAYQDYYHSQEEKAILGL